jgi:hypothetical protein
MRTRIVVLLVGLSAVLLSACTPADPFASNDLCKYYRMNSGEASDGQGAPYPITLTQGQTVSLSYVAEMKEGSAEFQLLTDVSDVAWQSPLKPTSTTTTLDVDGTLAAGNYNMIIIFSKVKNYKVCWKVDVK